MIIAVNDRRSEALDWVNTRNNEDFQIFSARTVTMRSKADELKAVVVMDNWSDYGCFMHIFSDGSNRWCSKKLINAVFAYVFYDCSKLRVTGIVDARNSKALNFDIKLGFRVEGIARDACGLGKDSVILGLTYKDWLNSRWGFANPVPLKGVA